MSDFNIDMTGKDYLSLIALADSYAAELLPEWTARDDSDINWVTIKTIAYLISIGMFYIDLSFNEKDPVEVSIYKNAVKLAQSYGMLPRKYAGATAEVVVGLQTSDTTYTLDRGTMFRTSVNNLPFALVESFSVLPLASIATLSVRYGEPERVVLGYSDGTAYQKFLVDDITVQNLEVVVTVDEDSQGEETWEQIDSMIMADEDEKVYRLEMTEDEKYQVCFGDTNSGKIPTNGSPIFAYLIKMPTNYSSYSFGNVPALNITSCEDSRVLTVSQPVAASGGQDKETIVELRRNIPQWISTANRAVTLRDYEYLARRVAGVGYVKASQVDLLVSLYVVPSDGGELTPALADAILAYIIPRKMVHIDVEVIAPIKVGIITTLSIIVDSGRSREEVRLDSVSAVSNFINKPFSVGVDLTVMDLYAVLKAVPGVVSASVSAFYREELAPQVADVDLLGDETSEVQTLTITASGGIV